MEGFIFFIIMLFVMVLLFLKGNQDEQDKVTKTKEYQEALEEEFTYLILEKKEKEQLITGGVVYNGFLISNSDTKTRYYLICKNKHNQIFELFVTTDTFYKVEIGQCYYFEPTEKEEKDFLKRYINN